MNLTKTHWSVIGVIIIAIAFVIAGMNLISKESTDLPVAGVASITLSNFNSSTVEIGDLQKVRWITTNYVPATVTLNVIRKVGDNPARYELVRTVSPATSNDGSAVWVPAKVDMGSNIFVEVGCTLSSQECHASQPTFSLAVVDTGLYANTASAYKAIEQLQNK
jgi:hypothetical protein